MCMCVCVCVCVCVCERERERERERESRGLERMYGVSHFDSECGIHGGFNLRTEWLA